MQAIDIADRGRLGTILAVACALVAGAFSPAASAQNFPSRPLRFIVPYGPGGAPDLLPRLLAPRMAADLGQPIVVENRSGGLGFPAINETLTAPADGHTVLVADSSHSAIVPAMQRSVPYEFTRDFAPLRLTFTSPMFYAVLDSSPARNFQELVALARAKPGTLNYASAPP